MNCVPRCFRHDVSCVFTLGDVRATRINHLKASMSVCVKSRPLWWDGVLNYRKRWFPCGWIMTYALFGTSQLKRVNTVRHQPPIRYAVLMMCVSVSVFHFLLCCLCFSCLVPIYIEAPKLFKHQSSFLSIKINSLSHFIPVSDWLCSSHISLFIWHFLYISGSAPVGCIGRQVKFQCLKSGSVYFSLWKRLLGHAVFPIAIPVVCNRLWCVCGVCITAFSLEGSGISFADLFRLVAFCCISR